MKILKGYLLFIVESMDVSVSYSNVNGIEVNGTINENLVLTENDKLVGGRYEKIEVTDPYNSYGDKRNRTGKVNIDLDVLRYAIKSQPSATKYVLR